VSNAVKSSDILATNLSFIMYPYLAKFLVTYKFQQTALSVYEKYFPIRKITFYFFTNSISSNITQRIETMLTLP